MNRDPGTPFHVGGYSPTWLELFPWLEGEDWDSSGAPLPDQAGSLKPREIFQVTGRVSRELVESRSRLTFAELAPHLELSLGLGELRIGTRMANALSDRGFRELSAIASMSVSDLLDWPKIGVGSVQTLVAQLLVVSTRKKRPAIDHHHQESSLWLQNIELQVQELAKWNLLIGRPNTSLLDDTTSTGEPGAVGLARHNLSQLSANDVFPTRPATAVELVGAALDSLGIRELGVLRERTFANVPATLDVLGELFSVTRERVRQIERGAVTGARSIVATGSLVGLQTVIRDQIGTIAALDGLLSSLPSLRELVVRVGQPLWRVLDRLDDAYEIRDSWCAAPSVKAQADRTRDEVQALMLQQQQQQGAVAISQAMDIAALANLSELEQRAWFSYCGFVELEGYLLSKSAGIGDRSAVVLGVNGEPASAVEIQARMGVDRSLGAIKNVLGSDPRFVRANRESWGLSSWGYSEYKAIRELIGSEVDAAGGQITLVDLITNLTTQFDVKAQSVVAYASAHPYRLENGRIRRLTSADVDGSGKSVWQTPRLHRAQGAWILRTILTSEHLRGSGTSIPSGLARALDVDRGSSRSFHTSEGEQVVSWKSPQPTLGSVRRLLVGYNLDQEVFMVFSDEGHFRFEARRPTTTPFDEILASVGLPAIGNGSSLGVLASSIGLRADAGITEIISALRNRHDNELAEMLEAI